MRLKITDICPDEITLSLEEQFDAFQNAVIEVDEINNQIAEAENPFEEDLGVSTEGFIDTMKSTLAKLKTIKFDKVKQVMVKAGNTAETIIETSKRIIVEVNRGLHPATDTISVSEHTFKHLTRNDKQTEYIDGLRQFIKVLSNTEHISASDYVTKSRWPKLRKLLAKNGYTDIGLSKTYNEMVRSKLLDVNLIIKDYIPLANPPAIGLFENMADTFFEKDPNCHYLVSKDCFLGNTKLVTKYEFDPEDKMLTGGSYGVRQWLEGIHPNDKNLSHGHVEHTMKPLGGAEIVTVLELVVQLCTIVNKLSSVEHISFVEYDLKFNDEAYAAMVKIEEFVGYEPLAMDVAPDYIQKVWDATYLMYNEENYRMLNPLDSLCRQALSSCKAAYEFAVLSSNNLR